MDNKFMSGPEPECGHRRRRSRLRRASVALAVGLVATGIVVAPNAFDAPAVAQTEAAAPPGLQAPVQRWLKDRERLEIELNNALVPFVQQQIADTARAPGICRRLVLASRALIRMGAAPHAQVDQLARAGVAKFEQGAVACLAGDRASAQRLVTEGLAERSTAQEPLDELLEGE